jgi:hypothetical protein
MRISLPALACFASLLSLPVSAQENSFLPSLKGSWTGAGTVVTRIGSKPINVKCNFDMSGGRSAFSMDGTCRGLLVVQRKISATLQESGNGYRGTYTGPSGQPSTLSGRQSGNRIDLSVRWARVINGDRTANMTIESRGNGRLRLQTVDKDPSTGKTLVTSSINLTR